MNHWRFDYRLNLLWLIKTKNKKTEPGAWSLPASWRTCVCDRRRCLHRMTADSNRHIWKMQFLLNCLKIYLTNFWEKKLLIETSEIILKILFHFIIVFVQRKTNSRSQRYSELWNLIWPTIAKPHSHCHSLRQT